MVSLLYGQVAEAEAPADENVVRTTTLPVDGEKGPAELKRAPDWNELTTDPDPGLGMNGRQVASDWHEPEQYAPAWQPLSDEVHRSAGIINDQVASSGTAAKRELAGEFGHGTMGYAVGVEPVIRDGGAFGNDYFAANERAGVNPTTTPETGVQSVAGDRDEYSAVSAYGRDAMRDAAESSLYARFLS